MAYHRELISIWIGNDASRWWEQNSSSARSCSFETASKEAGRKKLVWKSIILWPPVHLHSSLIVMLINCLFFASFINPGKLKFVSATYRMFKLPDESESQEACVKYNGSLAEYEQELLFDADLTFKVVQWFFFLFFQGFRFDGNHRCRVLQWFM